MNPVKTMKIPAFILVLLAALGYSLLYLMRVPQSACKMIVYQVTLALLIVQLECISLSWKLFKKGFAVVISAVGGCSLLSMLIAGHLMTQLSCSLQTARVALTALTVLDLGPFLFLIVCAVRLSLPGWKAEVARYGSVTAFLRNKLYFGLRHTGSSACYEQFSSEESKVC